MCLEWISRLVTAVQVRGPQPPPLGTLNCHGWCDRGSGQVRFTVIAVCLSPWLDCTYPERGGWGPDHSLRCLKQRVMCLGSCFVYIKSRGVIIYYINSSKKTVQTKLLGAKYRFIYFGTNFMKGFIRSMGFVVLPAKVWHNVNWLSACSAGGKALNFVIYLTSQVSCLTWCYSGMNMNKNKHFNTCVIVINQLCRIGSKESTFRFSQIMVNVVGNSSYLLCITALGMFGNRFP